MPYDLTYVSRATTPLTPAQLADLLRVCRAHNEELGVTGALLYEGGHIMQVLEGDQPTVEALYEVIAQDPRHREVAVVAAGPVSRRQFADWSMGFRDLSTDRSEFAQDARAFFASRTLLGERRPSAAQRLVLALRHSLVAFP
ncbi:hypothetical protein FHX74_002603 [Friedmanniella endophytica]|uniref:BLUF domain-containing protein n=1 Tax=Microlunatus kandeliicorticis TaxID=1759536 RepID=A0A7W3ITL2_9ACTN|nr:BLUF domain-containing protein [Microlunatus kandeliicorticis]MBA8794975.1 hypothetical protein [Microlunatus kandeliicorticis]